MASTSLSKIEHFVVLMLENRSFDHLFGFRHGVDGLHGDEANRPHPSAPVSATNPSIRVGHAAPFAIPTHHALGPFQRPRRHGPALRAGRRGAIELLEDETREDEAVEDG